MSSKRLSIFLGISLVLHLMLILLLASGMLRWIERAPQPVPPSQTVRLTLVERPPATPPDAMPQQRPFVETEDSLKIEEADPNAAFQAAENTRAQSRQVMDSQSVVPHLTGENRDSMILRDSPYSPQVEGQVSPRPSEDPTEKQEPQEEARESEAAPVVNLPRDGQRPLLSREEEAERRKLLEEQKKKMEARVANSPRAPPMAFSAERRQTSLTGGGVRGDTDSFGAEQTDLGRYKQKLYRAVGSRWYAYIEQSKGLVALGNVRIRFYVRSDGVFEQLKVISGDGSSHLYVVSRRSIMENSGQLEPFSERMKEQLGDGYWEEISFTIH
ncbi:MAG: hypothetical protein ACFCUX_02565 [Candidatus Methylacidiphilales bacterium]